MFGVDIFNYGHVMPNLMFQSEDSGYVWADQDTTLGFKGNPAIRTTQYLDYVITQTISDDDIDYTTSDPTFTFTMTLSVLLGGANKKTWVDADKTFKLKNGEPLNALGQPFRGYVILNEEKAVKWIDTDIEENEQTCAEQNKIENDDETCGDCLDGFMLDNEGSCISCASAYQKDGVGGRCGDCKEGYIVDEDENSESYGNCIEESPADYTLLYIGGGLIALAIGATLMKK
jgi:hypothetical protein